MRIDRVLDYMTDWLPFSIDPTGAAVVSAALLAWVGLVYLITAFGVRSGELVWSGRHPGRLPAEQRWWGALYGAGLIGSGLVLLEMTGVFRTGLLAGRRLLPAGFAVVAVLGVATLFALVKGSTWERMLFVPITLFGAALTAWLTFG